MGRIVAVLATVVAIALSPAAMAQTQVKKWEYRPAYKQIARCVLQRHPDVVRAIGADLQYFDLLADGIRVELRRGITNHGWFLAGLPHVVWSALLRDVPKDDDLGKVVVAMSEVYKRGE